MAEPNDKTGELLASMGGKKEITIPEATAAISTPENGNTAVSEAQSAVITPESIFGETFKDKDWEYVKTHHNELNTKIGTISQELETQKTKLPEYADPEVAQYDAWVRNGGEKNYQVFNKVKTAASDIADIDAIITQRVLENPSFMGLEDEIKNRLLTEFPIESTEESPLTPQQIAFNKAQIAEKAKGARDFLKTQQDKLKSTTIAPVDHEKIATERKQAWEKPLDAFLSSVKPVSIPMIRKEGDKDVTSKLIDYQVPDHVKATYKEALLNYASQADPSKEIFAKVEAAFYDRMIVDALPHIIGQVYDHVWNLAQTSFEEKHGGGMRPRDPGGHIPGTSDVAKGFMDHFVKK